MAKYVVKKGDTLADLAKKFGGSRKFWDDIRDANPGLKAKDVKGGLYRGMTINIPKHILTPEGKQRLKRTQDRRAPGRLFWKDDVEAGLIDPPLNPRQKEAQDAIMADPQYQAYLRYAGLEEDRLRDEMQYRTDQFNETINRRAAGFQEEKRLGQRDIGISAEDRGLFQSGMRMRDQSDFTNDVDRRRLEFEQGQRNDLDELLRRNQAEIEGLQLERSERELETRDRVGRENAQNRVL